MKHLNVVTTVTLDNFSDMEHIRQDVERFELVEDFDELGFTMECKDDKIIFTGEQNLPFQVWEDSLSINGWDLMCPVQKVEIEFLTVE